MSETDDHRISIIVPTYNSAPMLKNLLISLTQSEYKNFEVIVNDDPRSSDDLSSTLESFKSIVQIIFIQKNQSIGQARREGTKHARGDILLHLDSDMRVTPGLLGECVVLLVGGFDALIIPETSIGTTFWAKCKAMEKRCYENIPEIESPRCVWLTLYESVGGHDDRMVFSEDKDLDLKIRAVTNRIGRTKNFLFHDEDDLTLVKTMRKKMTYAASANFFAQKWPSAYRNQTSILFRYFIFLKNFRLFFEAPVVYVGMIFLKTCEFFSAAWGLILYYARRA